MLAGVSVIATVQAGHGTGFQMPRAAGILCLFQSLWKQQCV